MEKDNVLRFRVQFRYEVSDTFGDYPFYLRIEPSDVLKQLTNLSVNGESEVTACLNEAKSFFLDEREIETILHRLTTVGVTPRLSGSVLTDTWDKIPLQTIMNLFEVINPYLEKPVEIV
jgi:hypothetical protein